MPWNWTLHCASLFGFALTLLMHSYLMFAATVIIFGAGFFELRLPDLPENRWRRFVLSAVEWEKDWIAYPWTFRKWMRLLFVLLIGFVTVWALWTREPAALGMLMGGAYLVWVARDNKSGGVDL